MKIIKKKSGKVRIFVYGTLKKGGELHNYYLEGAEFVGTDNVSGELYAIGSLPYLFLYEKGETKVPGEVYDVKMDVFELIKEMEEGAGYKTVELSTVEDRVVKAFVSAGDLPKEGARKVASW